ncbi:MAG: hypothetical protein FCKEOINB_02484 [Nitrosomonas sp.]|nr:hypothetical protein [Nitrosomonas sp.]
MNSYQHLMNEDNVSLEFFIYIYIYIEFSHFTITLLGFLLKIARKSLFVKS